MKNLYIFLFLTSYICAQNVGDIVITEVMQNPSAVSDSVGEYFEVYNSTNSPIDMINWIIEDDITSSETHTIMNSVIVPAMGYAVFGTNGDLLINGGVVVDYEYSGIGLANGTDGLQIKSPSSTVIDAVIWDDGATFPDPTGASMELATNSFDWVSNDSGTNWGTAISPYGDGDLGTPGGINDYTLGNYQFDQIDFVIYPNPVSNSRLYISSSTNRNFDVKIFDIHGKKVLDQSSISDMVNISQLNTGLYILKISQDEITSIKKLVVE